MNKPIGLGNIEECNYRTGEQTTNNPINPMPTKRKDDFRELMIRIDIKKTHIKECEFLKHDFKNLIRKGRADYRCPICNKT